MMQAPQRKSMMQAFIATVLVVTFAGLVGWQTYLGTLDSDVKQTLIAGFFIAVGYYLGSSKGSQDKTDNAARIALTEETTP